MKKITEKILKKIVSLVFNLFFKKKIMKLFNPSWKSNVIAVLTALGALIALIVNCIQGSCELNEIILAVTALVGSFGFLFARDNDITSEEAGAEAPK